MMQTLTETPTGFDQTTWRCEDNVTHHDPNCRLVAGHVTECDYDTRGAMCCFRCFELPKLQPFERVVDAVTKRPGKPDTHRPPTDNDPTPDGVGVDVDLGAMESRLVGLPDKLPRDLRISAQSIRTAEVWLAGYTGTMDFLLGLKADWDGTLSEGQARAVLNCWRAEAVRATNPTGGSAQPQTGPVTALQIRATPAGVYMTEAGDRVRIDKPEHGNWAGWVFVSEGSEHRRDAARYGRQAPDGYYQGLHVDRLVEIADDPLAAAARYGRHTGVCGLCGRTLEDPESVSRGVGPVCANKF